jgi:RNA polymerase sigma-70 factor (ECF subfamily)
MSLYAGVKSLNPGDRFDAAAEQSLVEQARRKDYEAFTKIVNAYQARVHGFVRRMVGNEEEALDLTQDVFIRAFQAVDKFDGRSSVRTWLFRIAHNLCIDRSRRENRRPNITSLDAVQDDEGPREFADTSWDPQQMLLDDEFRGVVEHALEQMSDKLRTVLILHDREDMGYEEIASAVNIPVGTVKSRLFLARTFLQERVSTYLYGSAQ